MFDKLRTLSIQGGYFEENTNLTLFQENVNVSVVYGRNGSGKTTIAKGMRELAKTAEEHLKEEEDGRTPEYVVSTDAPIPEEKKEAVYVFDEDFIGDYVKVSEDEVKAIVMIGEQVDISDQIRDKTGIQKTKTEELKALTILRDKYADADDDISPQYAYNRIWEALRMPDGWADREREIRQTTMRGRVTENVMNKLMTMSLPKETSAEILQKLDEDLAVYQSAKDEQAIQWENPLRVELVTGNYVLVGVTSTLPVNLEALRTLLARPLDTPELTKREQRLMGMLTRISQHPQHFSQQNTRQLVDEKWPFCPLCLRDMNDDDRSILSETLTHILNKEAEEFEKELSDALEKFADVDITLPLFPNGLNKTEVDAAKVAIDNLNKVLTAIRRKIELRRRNIYEAIANPFSELEHETYVKAVTDYKHSLKELESCVNRFNKNVLQRNETKELLLTLNLQVARKEYYPLFDNYKTALDGMETNRKAIEKKEKEIETVKFEIKGLKQQLENTDIALKYINEELQYVFFNEKKVKLVPGEDKYYRLMINGKYVPPKKISVGERNVLGLCYFFAKMFQNKTEANKYSSEYLVVIDDPVSSFDYGNRLGVMSLLRYQFEKIVKGNPKSRILVMSHDLYSIFNLVKIKSEVSSSGGERYWELEDKVLKQASVKNEYESLLNHVYNYATDTGEHDSDEATEISIGNIMRRMMEAFSTFCYKAGFEEMLKLPALRSRIPEDKRSFYDKFMYRLILNGESHGMLMAQTLNTITSFMSRVEKVKTAKRLLLFMYYVNEPHLRAYLKNNVDVVKRWQDDEEVWKSEGDDVLDAKRIES